MLDINDQFGPNDDRSLGLEAGSHVSIRSATACTYTGRIVAVGLYFVDVSTPERVRIRLASIESVTWPTPEHTSIAPGSQHERSPAHASHERPPQTSPPQR